MGQLPKQFGDGDIQDITFSVTEDCNLRCKYCYMVHKNDFKKMDFETARKSVDYLLSIEPPSKFVIWDFIGGEPTLEMELIDQITDYIKLKQYLLNHPWSDNHMFFIGSNGILYNTDAVQDYITKNRNHVEIGITIDGTKEKHDLQRVKRDGSGSYDEIARIIPLWLDQFGVRMTKVTFASDDLCYLKDSIIHLWDMGITHIAANVVFEDVWKPGDTDIFENQLIQLADYILENKLWSEYSVRFFDPNVGFHLGSVDKKVNFCGTGKMIAIDTEGKFFPCVRFIDFCLSSNSSGSSMNIGNCQTGMDMERLRAFERLSMTAMNDFECENCEIASGCFACAGFNYDDSERKTIYRRAKHICQMQKAQVRANKYFWREFSKRTGMVSPHQERRMSTYQRNNWNPDGLIYLFFIINDNMVSHCNYVPNGDEVMSSETFERAMSVARARNMIPVFLGNPKGLLSDLDNREINFKILSCSDTYNSTNSVDTVIRIIDSDTLEYSIDEYSNRDGNPSACILRIQASDIDKLDELITNAQYKYGRVNIIKRDVSAWSERDMENYDEVLKKLDNKNFYNRNVSVNIFSDNNKAEMEIGCNAGVTSFTIAPNGKIYPCPAFYFENRDSYCFTDVENIRIEKDNFFTQNESPFCKDCTNYQCRRCVFDNKVATNFTNIPSSVQCKVAQIEQNYGGAWSGGE